MTLVRRIARPMLAAMFVSGGLDALRHPAGKVPAADDPMVKKVAQTLHLPDDTELLVRVNAATMLGAGSLLALGKLPRLASLALVGTLLPTTYAAHSFWSEQDPAVRGQQKVQFLKNVGLLGGLLLAAVDTAGRPGLSWRAHHAVDDVRRGATHSRKDARHAAKALRRETKLAAAKAHHTLT